MLKHGEYIKSTMTKDEKIMVMAKYHWVAWLEFYFFFATLGVVSIVFFIAATKAYFDDFFEASVVYSAFGLICAIYPIIVYLKLYLTEMVCTNRRVVSRTGIISIKTEEIKVDRLESIQIKQSIIGRILGYGNILFSGTGTAKVEFHNIKDPYQIKAKIEEAVDTSNAAERKKEKTAL